jgi:HicB family
MGIVQRRGETKTRTFRIDTAFNEELEAEAEKHSVSVNHLVEKIFERYLNHSRWVDERNSLTIVPSTMNKVLEALDDEKVIALGDELGSLIPVEDFMMRGMHMNAGSAKVLVEKILGEYDNWFKATYHHHSRPYFYLRTSIGEKWTLFVEAYLKAFFKKTMKEEVEIKRIGANIQIFL